MPESIGHIMNGSQRHEVEDVCHAVRNVSAAQRFFEQGRPLERETSVLFAALDGLQIADARNALRVRAG